MVYQSTRLDATFGALADPTRRSILARLAGGDKTISELAARFNMTLPAVSKHVRVLERAGLAHVRREGRVRRAALRAESLRAAVDWLEHYRRFWEYQLDQLAAYLAHPEPDSLACPPEPIELTEPTAHPLRSSKFGGSSPRRRSAFSRRGRERMKSSGGARRGR